MKNNYTIETKVNKRMAGGILEGCEMYEIEYVQHNILRDGELVGFVFDAEDIETAIEAMEKYPDAAKTINSRFD